uniref:Uncharacterized protein n=1 Tax=Panagrolaimus sp. PS1159 TaxID=55785 RepID=A0AC35FH31_9BILA
MVRIAVCYPMYSKAEVFKCGKTKSFNLSLGPRSRNLPYRPWEASCKDIIEYLQVIQSKSSQPLDNLVAICDNEFKNDFRQWLFDIARSWKIKNINIIDSCHLLLFNSIRELNIGQPSDSELLCEITLFRDVIKAKLWQFKIGFGGYLHGWTLLKTVEQQQLETSIIRDLEHLKFELCKSLSLDKYISYIFREFDKRLKQDIAMVFQGSKKTLFLSTPLKNPCKMAMKYAKSIYYDTTITSNTLQLYGQYRCKPIINKSIEIKANGFTYVKIGCTETLPLYKMINVDSFEEKNVLEIFECGKQTGTVKLKQMYKIEFVLSVDGNGIFYIDEMADGGLLEIEIEFL